MVCSGTAAGRAVVVYPLDKSTVREGGGMVVGYCDDKDTHEVEVDVNGKKYVIQLWDGVFDVDVKWQAGENAIVAAGTPITFVQDAWAGKEASASVHQAIYDNCGNCHVLGEARSLQRKNSVEELCRSCHEADPEGFEHRNPEVACTRCHVVHAAPRPHLLRPTEPGFCLTCHGNLGTGKGTAHETSLHQLNCLECHFRPILNGLCHSCHAPQSKKADSVHGAAVGRRACIGCHVPHGTGGGAAAQVCGGCHGAVESATPAHAAAVAQRCPSCHSMHETSISHPNASDSCAGCHWGPRALACDDPRSACTQCHRIHGFQ